MRIRDHPVAGIGVIVIRRLRNGVMVARHLLLGERMRGRAAGVPRHAAGAAPQREARAQMRQVECAYPIARPVGGADGGKERRVGDAAHGGAIAIVPALRRRVAAAPHRDGAGRHLLLGRGDRRELRCRHRAGGPQRGHAAGHAAPDLRRRDAPAAVQDRNPIHLAARSDDRLHALEQLEEFRARRAIRAGIEIVRHQIVSRPGHAFPPMRRRRARSHPPRHRPDRRRHRKS